MEATGDGLPPRWRLTMDEPGFSVDLTGQELVVHLFAPLDGPDAAVATEHLTDVWRQCQRSLGMSHEIAGLGLPVTLPADWSTPMPQAPHQVALAACTRHGNGVFQAIMRRHHDVANLSVVLAPATDVGEARSWAALKELWTQALGGHPAVTSQAEGRPSTSAERASAGPGTANPGLLGAVEIYVGRLRGASPAALAARPDTLRVLACLVPRVASRGLPDHRASPDPVRPAMVSGLAMWETEPRPDGRLERSIVLLGAEGDEPILSAWAWSRGTPEIPPFVRYLLHAAKVRYHLRVWGDGRAVRRLREDVDAMTTALIGLLDPDGADRTEAIRWQIPRLLAARGHVVSTLSATERMRRAVEIARWNMDEAVGGAIQDVGAFGAAKAEGLFRDDARMLDWFVEQLADDEFYLGASERRAGSTAEIARECLEQAERVFGSEAGAVRPVQEGTRRTRSMSDTSLTREDRDVLQSELARVFPSEAAMAAVLDRVGLDRSLRPAFAGSTPRDVWRAVVIDLENGRVDAPHRRLIDAALADYPFNEVFLRLAVFDGTAT